MRFRRKAFLPVVCILFILMIFNLLQTNFSLGMKVLVTDDYRYWNNKSDGLQTTNAVWQSARILYVYGLW